MMVLFSQSSKCESQAISQGSQRCHSHDFRSVFHINTLFSKASRSSNRLFQSFHFLFCKWGVRCEQSVLFPPAPIQRIICFFPFLFSLYLMLFLLAAIVSWSFPVEGKHLAQTVRAHSSAHAPRFYTLHFANNRVRWSQVKEKIWSCWIGYPSPVLERICLTRLLKQLCSFVYTWDFISCPSPCL